MPNEKLEKLKHDQYVAQRKLTAARHKEKRLENEIKRLTRSERTHRLCIRAGMLETFLREPTVLTDDDVMELLTFIFHNDIVVGAVRIVNKNDGSRKRISPIWIMGEFRNKGYAQQAMIELENIYGSDHWCLDTILQEKGNLHLYEKMGYVQTGKVEHINEKMDIVFYEKN